MPRKEVKPMMRFLSPLKAAAPLSDRGSTTEHRDQVISVGRNKNNKKKMIKRNTVAGVDQNELVDPVLLADPDSCFCEFKGVHLHYKVDSVESENPHLMQDRSLRHHLNQDRTDGSALILLHGFAASVFSWSWVTKPLVHLTGSKVLAFDRPAFGLTSRVELLEDAQTRGGDNTLNPYSPRFSVLATLHFMDMLYTKKAILVGHSAGAVTAIGAHFEAPDRVAALILVAPCILAPFYPRRVKKEKRIAEDCSSRQSAENLNLFFGLCLILLTVLEFVFVRVMLLAKGMVKMASTVSKKVLLDFLRSSAGLALVRSAIDKFGVTILRKSRYGGKQLTDQYLLGYTKGLKTKCWDKALVEYIIALFMDSASEPKSKPPISKRLIEIKCPVLIISGDSDVLVPCSNSERLAKAIPDAHFKMMENCGHLPHEEKPEEFISVIRTFLESSFPEELSRRLEFQAE